VSTGTTGLPSKGVWLFPDSDAASLVRTVVAAESLGLDEIWLGDEGPGSRDPFSVLAAAATLTRTITLGVAVTNPYLRHPATIASTAMTLQELGAGRAVLGLGAGGELSLGPVHVQRDTPLATITGAIRTIRSVTAAEQGDGYSPPGHAFAAAVPLYLGARGEQLNRLASTSADGVFLGGIPFSMLDLTLSWATSVRQVDVALYVNAVFDADELDDIRPRLLHPFLDAPPVTHARLGLDPAQLAQAASDLHGGDDRRARRLMTDELAGDLVLVGSPREVGRQLAALARQYRPRHIGLSFLTAAPDHHLDEARAAFAALDEELVG
jgi:5,10-methylenetetrahydromethanopterin reductase